MPSPYYFRWGSFFAFSVLQQGAWPLSQNNLSPLNIPVELEKTVAMYEKFYSKQFSGRKLTWLHHLSNGDIKLGYLPKTYIINMTTFQMSILLLFEKSDTLSFNELKATTKISDDQFPRHVQSLMEAKLLTCSTPVSISFDLVISNVLVLYKTRVLSFFCTEIRR